MAPRLPSPDRQLPAAAADSDAPELAKKIVAASDDDDEDHEEDDELDIEDDEEDEDLVVFTAKEAAGALATIYAFVKPFLKNYRKILALVGQIGRASCRERVSVVV